MMLTATGMRVSELLSIRHAGLQQSSEGLHYIKGTVYKFNGRGRKTRWLSGRLGVRAYAMLSQLSPGQGLCETVGQNPGRQLRGESVDRYLKEWVETHGYKNADGTPLNLHAHRFRRTFARQIIRYPRLNLLMLKDHFKHNSVEMTDYYVGNDRDLWLLLFKEQEAARTESFHDILRRETGLEGVA